jgi:uncharacterized membrane protein
MPKKYLKEIIASVFIIGLATTFLWAFYSLGYLTIGNFIAIAVVVFIFWAIFTVILKVGAYQQKLKKQYEDALDALRKSPSNNKLRTTALLAGRKYFEALRNGTLSIYDEQRIANDLAAISALPQHNNEVKNNSFSNDITIKLQKLSELKSAGLISEIEFEEKRKKILDQI